MTDGFIQVPPDSSGKKVDTSELTRADGTVVERNRIVVADPNAPSAVAPVDALRGLTVDTLNEPTMLSVLLDIKHELQGIAVLLGGQPQTS